MINGLIRVERSLEDVLLSKVMNEYILADIIQLFHVKSEHNLIFIQYVLFLDK